MMDEQRIADGLVSAGKLLAAFSQDVVTNVAINELSFIADTIADMQDYVAGLERALSEYVVLGAGKCTISKAHADMGRAALAAKP